MKGTAVRPKKRSGEEDSDDEIGGEDHHRYGAHTKEQRGTKDKHASKIDAIALPPAEDHNNDYCEVCHDGGDLICCDECPCAYHPHCLVMPKTNRLLN